MGTIKDLTDLTVKLIDSAKDRKFAGELREIQRMVAAIQSEHADIQEKQVALMMENAELKQKVASLQMQISEANRKAAEEQARAGEFISHRGALFKPKPGGGFDWVVYCPKCKISTSSAEGELPYHCQCGWMADFSRRDLTMIMATLKGGG